MLDSFWSRLVAKGNPTANIALHSRTYLTLTGLARAALPAETFGALVGRTVSLRADDESWIVIEDVVPVTLSPSGIGLLPDLQSWQAVEMRLARQDIDTEARLSILGWYFSDPAIGVFKPRTNAVKIREMLASSGDLLLLVNPVAEQSGFYLWRNGRFQSSDGFYEILDEDKEFSDLPWNGEVRSAQKWLMADNDRQAEDLDNALFVPPSIIVASELPSQPATIDETEIRATIAEHAVPSTAELAVADTAELPIPPTDTEHTENTEDVEVNDSETRPHSILVQEDLPQEGLPGETGNSDPDELVIPNTPTFFHFARSESPDEPPGSDTAIAPWATSEQWDMPDDAAPTPSNRRWMLPATGAVLGLAVIFALIGSLLLPQSRTDINAGAVSTPTNRTESNLIPSQTTPTITLIASTATSEPPSFVAATNTSVPASIPTDTATPIPTSTIYTPQIPEQSTNTPPPPTLPPTQPPTEAPTTEESATPEAAQPTEGPSQTQVTYVVKAGDTLNIIAEKFNTTAAAIMKANNLTSTVIRVGQVLIIPVKSAPTPAAAPDSVRQPTSTRPPTPGQAPTKQPPTYIAVTTPTDTAQPGTAIPVTPAQTPINEGTHTPDSQMPTSPPAEPTYTIEPLPTNTSVQEPPLTPTAQPPETPPAG